MGTIGNQQPRKSYTSTNPERYVEAIARTEEGVWGTEQVKTLIEAKKALEMERANNIAVEDGDNRDEHMGGIADCLHRIADALETIAARMP
jgi:hypothetical protein